MRYNDTTTTDFPIPLWLFDSNLEAEKRTIFSNKIESYPVLSHLQERRIDDGYDYSIWS